MEKENSGDISSLKTECNELYKEKEDWAARKSGISKKIKDLIFQVKQAKDSRNNFNEEIKKLKPERDKKNAEVRAEIEKIKILNIEKEKLPKGKDPEFILKQIRELNTKIETEVISYEKEKGIMKEIKSLRKEYEECKGKKLFMDKYSEEDKKLKLLKKESADINSKIQDFARKSEAMHKQVLSLSKEVDDLKIKENEFREKFFEKKREIGEKDAALKSIVEKTESEERRRKEHRERKKKFEEKQIRIKVSEKKKRVEEKLKRGEKLTTDDLIVLQSE